MNWQHSHLIFVLKPTGNMDLDYLNLYMKEIFFYEWAKTEIPFLRQHPVPLIHETIKLQVGFRADGILDNKVIIELKSIEVLADVHFKQLLTYLKLTNLKPGLLINFNVVYLKDGIHRIANKL